ncbi:MAG: PKD domain-containing protein [Nocardioides sp.]
MLDFLVRKVVNQNGNAAPLPPADVGWPARSRSTSNRCGDLPPLQHPAGRGRPNDPFPGGSLTTYVWTRGDGSTTTTASATASHTYASAGSKSVKLTVIDDYKRSNTVSRVVSVG